MKEIKYYWYGELEILSSSFIMNSQVSYDENNLVHNDDKPALTNGRGGMWWFKHGICHREDGPAVVNKYSYMYFFEGRYIKDIKSQEEWKRWQKLRILL